MIWGSLQTFERRRETANFHKDLGPGGTGCARLIWPLVKEGQIIKLTSDHKNYFGAPVGYVINDVSFFDFEPQAPWKSPMTLFYLQFKLENKKKLPGPEKVRTVKFHLKVNPEAKQIIGCPTLDDYK